MSEEGKDCEVAWKRALYVVMYDHNRKEWNKSIIPLDNVFLGQVWLDPITIQSMYCLLAYEDADGKKAFRRLGQKILDMAAGHGSTIPDLKGFKQAMYLEEPEEDDTFIKAPGIRCRVADMQEEQKDERS